MPRLGVGCPVTEHKPWITGRSREVERFDLEGGVVTDREVSHVNIQIDLTQVEVMEQQNESSKCSDACKVLMVVAPSVGSSSTV